MNPLTIYIFFLVASFIGAICSGVAVKSFRRRDYFVGGLNVMATFWVMLLIIWTLFKVV